MRKLPSFLLLFVLFPAIMVVGVLSPTIWAEGDGCTDLIINGNMEANTGWTFPATAVRGGYSSEQAFSPTHSARLGIVSGENKYAYSSMSQQVTVPQGSHLALSWRAYPLSQPLDANDLQYVLIKDQSGTLRTVWSGNRNDAAWLTCSYDISNYLDQVIMLYFGVKNDGAQGVSAMYADDVSLQLCSSSQTTLQGCQPVQTTPTPSPTVTPVPTATPTLVITPTPTQPPCRQLIANPGFDQGYSGWRQNLYVTASYRDEAGETHKGAWFGGAEYTDQYLYQDVIIPAGSPAAELSFLWAFDPPADGSPASNDKLTITLRRLDNAVLQTLMTIGAGSAPRRWRNAAFDLAPYTGQTVRIYAQSVTDAATTSWYLDQITLITCQQDNHSYLPLMMK